MPAGLGLGLVLSAAYGPVVCGRATAIPAIPGSLPDSRRPAARIVLDPMDSAWFGAPLAAIIRRAAHGGWPAFPTWSGATGCGEPLLPTTLGAVTSPLRWWTRWRVAGSRAWDLFYLLRVWLAGFLAFGLAVEMGLSPVPAGVAAVVYMLSGHFVLNLNLGMLDADVWLPGLCWAVLALVRGDGRLARLAVAGTGAGVLLVGNPQPALLAAVFAAWLAGDACLRLPAARLRPVLEGGTIAVLLAAPLLFPLADFFPRAQHVHAGEGMVAVPWQGALSLVGPWCYGRVGEHWLGRNPFDFLTWIGATPLLLAAIGTRTAWRLPGGRALALTPLLLWAFAFGVPPFHWLARLPVLNLIWWGKYQAPAILSVALLAGAGAGRIAPRGRRAWVPAAVVVCELLWVTSLASLPDPVRGAARGLPEARVSGLLRDLQSAQGLLRLRIVLSTVAIRAMPEHDRVFLLGRSPMPHVVGAACLDDASTYFGLYPRRAYWYVRALVTGPARNANDAVFTGPVGPLLPRAGEALRAMAVRWVIADRPAPAGPPAGAVLRERQGGLSLLELPGARARARLVARALRVGEARQALFETSMDPAGDIIYVEGPEDWIGFHVTGVPARARIVLDQGARIGVEVPGTGVRVLLLADTYEPGWRADAGPMRLRVLPANCMFKAVAVPPGHRLVMFRFDPMPLKAGLLAAGIGLGCLACVFLPVPVHPRRRRRG